MKRIAAGVLLISAVLAVSSCEEYFFTLSPDAEKTGQPGTTDPNNPPTTPTGTGGGTTIGLVLEWEE
jgi:hypothetical protein